MDEDCDRCAMFEEVCSQKSSLSGEKGHQEGVQRTGETILNPECVSVNRAASCG